MPADWSWSWKEGRKWKEKEGNLFTFHEKNQFRDWESAFSVYFFSSENMLQRSRPTLFEHYLSLQLISEAKELQEQSFQKTSDSPQAVHTRSAKL